jgi:putative transposase
VLFAVDADFQFFRDCLQDACEKHGCEVHAYVFMTNHVHLLMTPTTESSIGRVMQSVGRRYVQRFNTRYQRTGTLWEGRYRATVVLSERYLFACYRYIEMNPVRAGLVASPHDYRWSSFRANALGARDPMVVQHERYCALGADVSTRQSAYRALFEIALAESTLVAIREATNKGWTLGSEPFGAEIATLVKRRTRPLRALRTRDRKMNEESDPLG